MFFKRSLERLTAPDKPIDPDWRKTESGKFARFIRLDPMTMKLKGRTGVFILWNGGVRPTWVFVGSSRDLARDFQWCAENKDITYYENFGGLFCSWAYIKREYQAGAVRYLTQVAKPAVSNPLAPGSSVAPIAVALPGAKAGK